MREIRTSGSEGGGIEANRCFLPLYLLKPVCMAHGSLSPDRKSFDRGAGNTPPWLALDSGVGLSTPLEASGSQAPR
jgi:hypothetical protein